MDNKDFAALAICAIRYCFGRQTYIPELIRGIVRNNIDKIAVLGASETAPWGSEPHFLFKLSTEACENISFSFKLGGTKKAPRGFKLQYSLDNNQFIDIEQFCSDGYKRKRFPYSYSKLRRQCKEIVSSIWVIRISI